ncbi:hypothetical protein HDA32_004926 [Spinactinospora alkalitolerans]|uniref:Uncharacterized protein n=1 Tax=Spinactinospora alkalitolerans TaxID=687207 RepID=A0A852TZ12_9ACTN|nr:hypothetical protein [Spinactinospora alkalitolerans]NYE49806.1 hypothetical protein [Spinactinospora alkalitolerans]
MREQAPRERRGLADHGRRVVRELSFLLSRVLGFGTGGVAPPSPTSSAR